MQQGWGTCGGLVSPEAWAYEFWSQDAAQAPCTTRKDPAHPPAMFLQPHLTTHFPTLTPPRTLTPPGMILRPSPVDRCSPGWQLRGPCHSRPHPSRAHRSHHQGLVRKISIHLVSVCNSCGMKGGMVNMARADFSKITGFPGVNLRHSIHCCVRKAFTLRAPPPWCRRHLHLHLHHHHQA